MSCDCRSYNWEVGTKPEVVLRRPEWIPEGERLNGVPVDACIVSVILRLWNHNVKTLSSCCGHNRQGPSLVIHGMIENYDYVRKLLDDREWKLYQWQDHKLVEV